jgi:methylmalonyl-CoA mutase cobalamin-binding subunit
MAPAVTRKLRVVVAKPGRDGRDRVGGTIPGQDIPELTRLGVAAVFTPGAPLQDIADFLRRTVGERTPA